MWKILRLNTWQGDHFTESYDYRLECFTDNQELVDELVKIKVAKIDTWPECHMYQEGWPVYKVVKIKPIQSVSELPKLKLPRMLEYWGRGANI